MPKFLFTVLAGAMLLTAPFFAKQAAAQAPTKQWDKTFGGSSEERLWAMQVTRDGGSILGGNSNSGISGDKTQANRGEDDYWVVKLDAAGNKLWDKTFGGSGDEYFYAVQQTADGGYLLGGTSASGISGDKTQASNGYEDFWVVRLDANGNKIWDKTYGGSDDDALTGIQLTSDGGFLLGGYSSSGRSGDKTQPSQGSWDVWVVKIYAQGNKIWDRSFGGSSSDFANAMSATRDGGVVLAGESRSPISGDKSQPNQGGYDYWIVKLDATGQKQWDRTLGGSGYDEAYGVQQSADGGYILNGITESGISGDKTQASRGGRDYWVVKLDAAGMKLWDRTLGGAGSDQGFAVLATSDGGATVGGMSSSGITGDKTQVSWGGSDFWLVRVNGTGTILWDLTLGGTDGDGSLAANGIQATSDGGLLVAGESASSSSGDKTQNGPGMGDFWVVKLTAGTTTATAPGSVRQVLSVYPNPARSTISLCLPDQAPRNGLWVSLVDATGRILYSQALAVSGTGIDIQVDQYPVGLYFLRLDGPDGYHATSRLVLN
ncbi:T9SS type A sorting domain-containing protein [Hymenobacter lucidus]|uniref:T9SS type A sorting domain-containing protein n=1 Tax=Hymenobacter lucidus TaxID=2880930 RepID=A0ABS8AZD4_9BACT|nr:T9SS type A sorting domain-containing protein [Hymenobacter lucidus]MCB2411128.1 T9SS type A sorting domain-containing protein [Hymenobacter lucidus]